MIRVWVVAPVVASEQGHEHAVHGAEAEDLGVEDQVEAVLVVFARADEKTDLVQDGCDAEQ